MRNVCLLLSIISFGIMTCSDSMQQPNKQATWSSINRYFLAIITGTGHCNSCPKHTTHNEGKRHIKNRNDTTNKQ